MAKTLRIALVTVAALAAGSSTVLAQTRGRMMDNDTRAVGQLPPSGAARAQGIQFRDQQVQPGYDDWNPDGTSPRVDSQ